MDSFLYVWIETGFIYLFWYIFFINFLGLRLPSWAVSSAVPTSVPASAVLRMLLQAAEEAEMRLRLTQRTISPNPGDAGGVCVHSVANLLSACSRCEVAVRRGLMGEKKPMANKVYANFKHLTFWPSNNALLWKLSFYTKRTFSNLYPFQDSSCDRKQHLPFHFFVDFAQLNWSRVSANYCWITKSFTPELHLSKIKKIKQVPTHFGTKYKLYIKNSDRGEEEMYDQKKLWRIIDAFWTKFMCSEQTQNIFYIKNDLLL